MRVTDEREWGVRWNDDIRWKVYLVWGLLVVFSAAVRLVGVLSDLTTANVLLTLLSIAAGLWVLSEAKRSYNRSAR